MSVRVVTLDLVGSTNDEVVSRANAGAPMPLAVRALAQSAGRGRLSRAWGSPAGGVWLSVIGAWDGEAVGAVALRSALAVVSAVMPELSARGGSSEAHKLTIKWPNDLLLRGRKIAGVLCERRVLDHGDPCLIIGVGINADFDAQALPAGVRIPATTLRTALGRPVDTEVIAGRLVDGLGGVLGRAGQPLDEEELHAVLGRLAYLDERVSYARLDGRVVSGVLAGLMADGRAVVRVGDSVERVNAGEIDRAGLAEC